MRGWWVGVVLASALLAACDQVLTGVTLGGKGRPYANPGAGGWSPTDGGADESPQATCTGLAVLYEAAVSEAQRCTIPGASEQCARTVPAHLSPCETCLTYVNDPMEVLHIADQWLLAGCDQMAGSNCTPAACPFPTNSACVGGTGAGRCSSIPRPADPPDAATTDCAVLLMRYTAALGATQYCTPGAPDQCAKSVPSTLNPCLQGCVSYLNDTTLVEAIVAEWKSLGCGNPDDASLCSDNAHTCPAAVPKTCMLYDNGVAICASAPPAP